MMTDFGEDLFFFGDHLLLVGKFVISAGKSVRISAKTFFFGDHLLLVGKFVISARKSLRISARTFAPLILILPPPPDLAKLATPLIPIVHSKIVGLLFFVCVVRLHQLKKFLIYPSIGVAGGGPMRFGPTPIEMSPVTKNVTKKPIICSVSDSFAFFAYNR